ncbi:Mycophenolic acid acyl-glucuronide esterase, mitochondrial [Borealophlyctis nickersoniae]|nr:Mycophenolic acid acyl-glucuronide esterase, mitochondrial [Borealophlyctis nickersoniae]
MPGFTLSKAVADTHRVFQDIAPPCPHVLVGSSMGLWIALHIAKMCPERVVGVVGVGGAVNFVRRMEDRIPGKEWLRMHEESESGRVEHPFCRIPSRYDPNGYIVGWNLLRDANKWVVTPGWDVECPVELIHGLRDEDVPYTESVRTADMLKGRDVRVTLVKDGDHRLSRQEDLEVICEAVERVIGKWKSGGGTNEQS